MAPTLATLPQAARSPQKAYSIAILHRSCILRLPNLCSMGDAGLAVSRLLLPPGYTPPCPEFASPPNDISRIVLGYCLLHKTIPAFPHVAGCGLPLSPVSPAHFADTTRIVDA